MFDGATYDRPVPGPYVAVCGAVGPYCVRAPTRARPNRLIVLSCTRPAHDDDRHIYATADGVVIATWDRAGSAVSPLPNQPRSNHGPANPV